MNNASVPMLMLVAGCSAATVGELGHILGLWLGLD